MSSLPSFALLGIFAVCAAAIWMAGIKLSDTTDVISQRWHLGSAMGGVILLAIATNLPEIAITVSAALAHQLDVAVGNLLGGIALQTLVLEGALVVALLVVVVMSTQLPETLIVWRVTPGALLIAVIWIVGLFLLRRAGQGLPWHQGGHAPDSQDRPRSLCSRSTSPGSSGWR